MASRRFQLQRNQKLYAKKEFTFGTQTYLPGDIFPYKKVEASWKRVVDMFAAMTLIGENDLAFEDVMEQKRIRLGEMRGSKEIPDNPVPEVGASTPPVVKLRNRARGWYDVLVDGEKVNDGALRKIEALRLMEGYNE